MQRNVVECLVLDKALWQGMWQCSLAVQSTICDQFHSLSTLLSADVIHSHQQSAHKTDINLNRTIQITRDCS